MEEIRSMLGVPVEEIHEAFADAFAEYEVKLDLPLERLVEMMRTRSWAPDLSLGAFEDGRLVGFLLCGRRTLGGEGVGYDVATGVVRDRQGRRIGDRLLEATLAGMPAAGLSRFLLEVLVNNEPARKLYERRGFRITRRLNCYERPVAGRAAPGGAARGAADGVPGTAGGGSGAGPARAPEPRLLSDPAYSLFAPSWQNSLESFRAGFEHYAAVGASAPPAGPGAGPGAAAGAAPDGFALVHRRSGGLLQIGLREGRRDPATLDAILKAAESATAAAKLVFLNVEEGCALEPLLVGAGFSRTVDQYEMEYRAS